MNNEKQLETRLKDLGTLLRSQPSPVERGLQRINDAQPVKSRRSLYGIPLLTKPGLGVAACLLISLCLWFFMTLPSTVTLAEVQEAVKARTWIHIAYDDGDQEWANLRERRSYFTSKPLDDGNFYAGTRDHVNGVWRYYHRNWGEQIHEKPFTPLAYPQSPWEYAVGDWDNRGIRSPAR